MKSKSFFQDRKLLIVTKHHKEKALAPILEQKLGVQCFVNPNIDTDVLGTFTGEVERIDNAIATARKKCLLGLKTREFDLVLASEGSFGPHPSLFFVPSNEEILYLIDHQYQLEYMVSVISMDTNFNGKMVHNKKELFEFAESALFPSHALILRKNRSENQPIVKGVTQLALLNQSYDELFSSFGSVYVETDMRALFNPKRMKVIESAGHKLVQKLTSNCPSCKMPGFDVTDKVSGLPCSDCHTPTKSYKSYVYSCVSCEYTETKEYPEGKAWEEPRFCDMCNP